MNVELIDATTALPLLALATGVVNAATWPRGARASDAEASRTSFVVPARNEALNIEACVRAIFAAAPDALEVIVADDLSTDATPEILARLQSEFASLRVIKGIPLPEGWVGKPHACHRLAQAARGDLLVFVDADVRLHPQGLQRLTAAMTQFGADVATVFPRQEMGTAAERLIVPMLHLTYSSWLPQVLIPLVDDPRVLAANGQVLAVRREAYDALGGFEAVRHEVVDDMAFCRNAKRRQRRVVFVDGHHVASCRMYRGAQEAWRGFSKNLYEGIGESPVALGLVLGLYIATFVMPWVLLVGSVFAPALFWPAMVGVSANVLHRLLLVWRHGLPLVTVATHVLQVGAFVAIAINSAIWSRRGRVSWSGRTYAARRDRRAEVV